MYISPEQIAFLDKELERGTKDGKPVLSFTSGARIVTDEALNVVKVCGMEPTAVSFTLTAGDKTFSTTLNPNEIYEIKDGALVLSAKLPFSCPKGVTE